MLHELVLFILFLYLLFILFPILAVTYLLESALENTKPMISWISLLRTKLKENIYVLKVGRYF